jgi:hypothetical protein
MCNAARFLGMRACTTATVTVVACRMCGQHPHSRPTDKARPLVSAPPDSAETSRGRWPRTWPKLALDYASKALSARLGSSSKTSLARHGHRMHWGFLRRADRGSTPPTWARSGARACDLQARDTLHPAQGWPLASRSSATYRRSPPNAVIGKRRQWIDQRRDVPRGVMRAAIRPVFRKRRTRHAAHSAHNGVWRTPDAAAERRSRLTRIRIMMVDVPRRSAVYRCAAPTTATVFSLPHHAAHATLCSTSVSAGVYEASARTAGAVGAT